MLSGSEHPPVMGEKPGEIGDSDVERLAMGEPVFDEDGNELGEIRGFDATGFYVTTREGYEAMSVEHARSSPEFGEAHLMWRCTNCGEMGRIDEGLPETCPSCGSPREDLYYWTED